MIIYPAIDLRGGRVVRLTEGKFDQEKSYGDDPLAVARGFKAAGAAWLHVVDLDGAKDPAKRQTRSWKRSPARAACASRPAAAFVTRPRWPHCSPPVSHA
ncbi:MAG: HisA/HisF-related TIM barrel protein [Lacunisphaera sp.]